MSPPLCPLLDSCHSHEHRLQLINCRRTGEKISAGFKKNHPLQETTDDKVIKFLAAWASPRHGSCEMSVKELVVKRGSTRSNRKQLYLRWYLFCQLNPFDGQSLGCHHKMLTSSSCWVCPRFEMNFSVHELLDVAGSSLTESEPWPELRSAEGGTERKHLHETAVGIATRK